VFESVNVDAIVSIYVGTTQPSLRINEFSGNDVRMKKVVPKKTLKSPFTYDWLFSDFGDLLAKLDGHTGRLSDLGVCENSCATDDAYRLRELITERTGTIDHDQYLTMINTGTIAKYISRWGKREMVYLGSRYTRPVVNRKRFLQEFPKSYGQKSIRKKLILKGLNLLDACLDADGSVIPGIPTLVIFADDDNMLKLLLAIVNSPLAFAYIKEKYPGSSYNQGTTFTKEMLNDLPVPKFSAADRGRLISSVDQILSAKLKNPDADTKAQQAEIDRTLYALYGLTPAEVGLVEKIARK